MTSGLHDILLVVSLLAAVVSLVLAVVVLIILRRQRRSLVALQVAEGRESVLDVLARTRDDFYDLQADVTSLRGELSRVRRDLAHALRHVSVVRYDAFGDLGGRFSFSAALLDDEGDGLIITSIHARTETRTYLKGIAGGECEVALSPEETEAVVLARGGAA